ncbi:MAG: tRNA (guanosine(46)-N7)-methyltransferase TrmB [Crocinitomicaceae bacterium]|nr:tRNA (guanosine(46)-N7)-methyltransferase TrmB [Crocinitomicaceae bacterium]
MAKKKLIRFEDIKTMDFVFEPTMEMVKNDSFPLKGSWNEKIFKNNNPIILELGCGKGEYSVQLGKMYPDKNFIGVDIKGARIWHGANEVRQTGMKNVAFIRTRIDFIETFFTANEVDEIWLTFSDPQPKKPRKRLTSRLFIERYLKFLKPGGIVHLKTDNSWLFASTLEQIDENGYHLIQKTWDLYGELVEDLDEATREILNIRTHYEKIFSEKGFDIKYVKFTIN